jgi:hypothetical protein
MVPSGRGSVRRAVPPGNPRPIVDGLHNLEDHNGTPQIIVLELMTSVAPQRSFETFVHDHLQQDWANGMLEPA